MNWQHVALHDCAPQAWRNGGGITHELATWPTPSDWRWRVSVARIDRDGPFSAFDSVQRWFAVLTGDGVTLSWPSQQRVVTPESAPVSFAGSPACDARLLSGSTLDFNLMARGLRGTLTRHSAAQAQAIWPAGAHVGVYACDDCVWVCDGITVEQSAHSLRWTQLMTASSGTWLRGTALVFVLQEEDAV